MTKKNIQNIYKVHLADAVDAINEAAVVYSGLQFGAALPETAIEQLTNAADEMETLHVSKACKILSNLETPKMLGGANKGLHTAVKVINEKRFRGA